MPKRTNAFQTVVYLLKEQLADATTIVTESAELADRLTGKLREVDVCIEAKVAGETIVIGIECTASKDAVNVEWVDRMSGKHSTLPTDRLVLVSEAGFSCEALKKAKALGIETIVPDNLTDKSAAELVHRVTRLRLAKLDLLGIDDVYVVLGATGTEEREADVHLLPSSREMNVYTESNAFIGIIGDVIQAFMAAATRDESLWGDLLDVSEDIKAFELSVDLPSLAVGDPPNPRHIYFEKTEPTPHLRQIEQLRIVGKAQIEQSDFPLRRGMFRDTPYSWGESFVQGKPAVVVVTGGDQGQLKITPRSY